MSDVNDIPDNELLGRIMRNAGHSSSRGRRRKVPRWIIIADLTTLGSTYSQQLCRRFGLDPDEMVRRP